MPWVYSVDDEAEVHKGEAGVGSWRWTKDGSWGNEVANAYG